jgi:hypothetical protein
VNRMQDAGALLLGLLLASLPLLHFGAVAGHGSHQGGPHAHAFAAAGGTLSVATDERRQRRGYDAHEQYAAGHPAWPLALYRNETESAPPSAGKGSERR